MSPYKSEDVVPQNLQQKALQDVLGYLVECVERARNRASKKIMQVHIDQIRAALDQKEEH